VVTTAKNITVYEAPTEEENLGSGIGVKLIVCEALGVKPEALMALYAPERIGSLKFNQYMKDITKIWEQDGHDANFTEVNSPFPLYNRVFMDFMYLYPSSSPDQPSFQMSSSDGNGQIP
jgi:hypothetical protein